jgi:hypothetical protein
MSSDTPGNSPLLCLIPLNELHLHEFPELFTERTLRRICRDLTDVKFGSLRHQVSVLASAVREGMSIVITNAQLSQLFGRLSGWAQGIMARYDQEVESGHPFSWGRPLMVESEIEGTLFSFVSHDKSKGIQLLLKISSVM